MALSNTTVNSAPVSTEELLSKGTKKASLAPEDESVFVEKNTSQLGYERTWEKTTSFSIESNGNVNSITLQNVAYGIRADTAMLIMFFRITLKGNTKDNSCMANMFPFVACDNFTMRVGVNGMPIQLPNEHFIHRFINILNSNFSKQDKINVLPLVGCYPELSLGTSEGRKRLAFINGFNFTDDFIEEKTRLVSYRIPLTLIHQMFNHKTILPVGTKIEFSFVCNASCNSNTIVNGSEPGMNGSFEFLPKESGLYTQSPERDPAIMLAQLENRQYLSEGLNFECLRFAIPKGSTYFHQPILGPGSKLPVKMDFAFVPASSVNTNTDCFNFRGFYLRNYEVIYNGPFPVSYKFNTFSSEGNGPWEMGTTQPLDRFGLYNDLFSQTDTFLIDKYGESYNNETTYPPLNRINPYMAHLADSLARRIDDQTFVRMKELYERRQVYTVILQPSKIFDGSAYPTVEGSLDMNLCFSQQTTEILYMYVNLNYFEQLIIDEDYSCEVRNLTLDNFRTDKQLEPSSGLPPPTGEDLYGELPVGEAENANPN